LTHSSGDFSALWADFSRRASEAALKMAAAGSVTVGCSLKEEVWRQDKAVLYRFLPLPFVQASRAKPVLICFALVNRPSVLDLQTDRSLIRRLLAAGLEVYLIDWGRPDDSDRDLDLSYYIDRCLGGCVRHILQAHGIEALNLLGVCQGGTFSLCYCALNPRQVENLVTMVTPVDFHTPDNLLSKWARHLDMDLIRRAGNVPGPLLTGMFLSLSPFRLMHQKYVDLLDPVPDVAGAESFVRMEKWIFDSPDQAAAANCQFVQWFYQQNSLVRGTVELRGRRVQLERIRQPVLNIYATQDHIVPPSAAVALRRYIGSRDYTEAAVDTGHIGIYVSRRAQEYVPARIAGWLRERASG
jgi:polyhydroxyalkanoate synthase subunit PhaC